MMREAGRQGRRAVSIYMQEIHRYPVLTVEREREMARPGAGPVEGPLRDELVTSSLGFVVRIALEYRSRGLPFEDLLNEGNLGLIEAARHYDPSRGTRFITCAVWWIRKSILKALARHASLVRVPSYQLRKVQRVNAAARSVAASLGRTPGRQELSAAVGLSPAKIDDILQMKMRALSLDEPAGSDTELRLTDRLIDDRLPSPEAAAILREREALIRRLLPRLDARARAIVTHRFGLDGEAPMTLKEVGDRLGVSREAVRLVEVRALGRLRRLVARERVAPPSATADASRHAAMAAVAH